MEDVTPEEAKALQKAGRRHSKYRAIKMVVDGHVFPSKKQATRYRQLKSLLSSGDISIEAVQQQYGRWMEVPFELFGKNGTRVGRYTADFIYHDHGALIAEEVKGYKVRDYALRKKVFLDNYPEFTFRET